MDKKTRIIILAVAAAAALCVGAVYWGYRARAAPVVVFSVTDAEGGGDAEGLAPVEPAVPEAPEVIIIPTITVHIVGEVANPGVYEVPDGSIVYDVLQQAGGGTPYADLEINLARAVRDGEQIRIPHIDNRAAADAADYEAAAQAPDVPEGPLMVNVNTAGLDELIQLPNVGPVTAQNIINHREAHGPFQAIDDLLAVTRIGPSVLEGLRPYITIG